MDRGDGSRFHHLVAARSGHSRIHSMERTNGMSCTRLGPLGTQDAAHAGAHGAHEGPHGRLAAGGASSPSSGNAAFDEYKAETLRRLEEEQKEFRSFLDRLRMSKDRAEFDQFMADAPSRRGRSRAAAAELSRRLGARPADRRPPIDRPSRRPVSLTRPGGFRLQREVAASALARDVSRGSMQA